MGIAIVGNILEFKRPPKNYGCGNTLCNEGHHKWLIVQDKQFDSQSGKLVTLFECSRCKKKKTQLL